MLRFQQTNYAQAIYFGVGGLERLPEAVAALGWRRVLVIAGGSAQRSGRAERVRALLGARAAGVFTGAQAHVPAAQVAEVAALAAQHGAEALLGLGGGSAIGLAKAVSAALAAPVAAIPTTYAGSEMTAVYGVTETGPAGPRKVTHADPAYAPRLVIYDPALTLDLPPQVTATTGVNALAHAIEAVYSIRRTPLATAAALAGLRRLVWALPRCTAHGDDLAARTELLAGAHLAGAALAGVAMGLHHGLCHVLGGAAGVPHGTANAIVLPHVLRYNRDAVPAELAQVAETLGVTAQTDPRATAQAGIERLDKLLAELGVPRTLREVGVPRAELPRLAELALHSPAVRNNPRPVGGAADVQAILEAAW
jgi:maleylacetate reductase